MYSLPHLSFQYSNSKLNSLESFMISNTWRQGFQEPAWCLQSELVHVLLQNTVHTWIVLE